MSLEMNLGKRGVVLISAALFSMSAFAECPNPQSMMICGADTDEYQVKYFIYPSSVSAQVIEKGKSPTDLTCEKAETSGSPDKEEAEISCRDPKVVDAGLSVEIMTPNFAGVTSAVVSQVGFAGAQSIAKLNCKKY